MTPLQFTLALFGFSVLAGLVGSLLGLGGGIVIVPALTLVFGIDIRLAIGASIIAVVATSSGAAAAYVTERLTNLRLAMSLEVATVAGALSGALVGGLISVRALYIVFGVVLVISAVGMLRNRSDDHTRPVPASRLADRLRLHTAYYDAARGETIPYRVTRVPIGAAMMYVAGGVSGLLGLGGGAFKVPAMDLAMRLPIKVSTATSNLMIGVTAAASAAIYFGRGDINPFIAAPVAAGVLAGATAGSRLLPRLRNSVVRGLFVVALLYVSIEMLRQGL